MAVRQKTALIVVHVTATPPSADIGAKEVDRMHKARGWNGIGYHFVIRRNGQVEKGRPINQVGAHVRGFNSQSVGVSLEGGVDERGKPQDNRTAAQTMALKALLGELVKKYPEAKICGHRDLSPDRDRDGIIEPHEHMKACPCFDAIPWARENGLPAYPVKGVWDTSDPTPAGPDDRTVYLQKLLKRAGYEFGAIDGIVGPKTTAAIKRFQNAAGFKVTGKFDEPTVARLRAMFEASKETVVVEKDKPVVSAEVEDKARKGTNALNSLVGGGGTAVAVGSAALGADWMTVLAVGGLALAAVAGIVIFRRHIIAAIRDVRGAV